MGTMKKHLEVIPLVILLCFIFLSLNMYALMDFEKSIDRKTEEKFEKGDKDHIALGSISLRG